MGRAEPPVQVEVLREERGGDEPCSVVHRPLGAELAHPGVHDRVAGPPFLPRRERVGVVAPAIVTRTEVASCDPGIGIEQLMVEVAPAELAHERLAAGLGGRAVRDLERRQASEVEVRGEARRPLDGEVVAACVVVGEAVAHPAREAGPSLGLTAPREVRGDGPARQVPDPGERPVVDRPGGGDRRRCGEDRSPWRGAPPVPVRGEHAVRPAGAPGRDVARGNDRHPWKRPDEDAPLPGRAAQPSLPRLREAAHVLAQVDASRAGLHRDAEHLRDRVPTADDETTAAGRERAPEVGQRLEEEGDTVRGAEAGEQHVVEDEDRDDMGRVLDGGVEGGMVVHPEVPGEEDDGRAHHRLPRARDVTRPVRRATRC